MMFFFYFFRLYASTRYKQKHGKRRKQNGANDYPKYIYQDPPPFSLSCVYAYFSILSFFHTHKVRYITPSCSPNAPQPPQKKSSTKKKFTDLLFLLPLFFFDSLSLFSQRRTQKRSPKSLSLLRRTTPPDQLRPQPVHHRPNLPKTNNHTRILISTRQTNSLIRAYVDFIQTRDHMCQI